MPEQLPTGEAMASPNLTWYVHSHFDPVDLVASEFAERAYYCPTVELVDAHLRMLRSHVDPERSNFSDVAKARTRRDMDRLLERRLFLRVLDGEAA